MNPIQQQQAAVAALSLIEAAVPGTNNGIVFGAGAWSARHQTALPTVSPITGEARGQVYIQILLPAEGDTIYLNAFSSPDGGIVAGSREGAATIEGAEAATRRLLDDLKVV
jgi:hypothetical protein